MNQSTQQHYITSANAALEARDFSKALKFLTLLKTSSSPSVAVLQSLAMCHYHLGNKKAALSGYQEALSLDPQNTKTINSIAVISTELGRPEKNDHDCLTPKSLNSIGLAQYFRGDFDAAKAAFETAIEKEPNYFTAYYNISNLIEDSELDVWHERIKHLAPNNHLDKSSIAYLEASLLHRLGAYEDALDAWHRASTNKERTFEKQYSPVSQEKLVSEIINVFDANFFRNHHPIHSNEPPVVFIVGLPRSGSTLLAQHLCTFTGGRDLGERQELALAIKASFRSLEKSSNSLFTSLADSDLQNIKSRYFERLPNSHLYVDKYLENFLFLGVLWRAFKNAKVIFVKRNRFDTLFSCYSKNFTMGNKWTTRFENLTHYADQMDRLMAHWKTVLPSDFLTEVSYEQFTASPEETMSGIVKTFELPIKTSSVNSDEPTPVYTASAKQVRAKIKHRDRSPYEMYKDLIPLPPDHK